MKNLIKTIILSLALVVSLGAVAQQKESKVATVVINAEIDCNNCKKKIEKNIAFEKGVKDLKVDLPTKTVTITYRTDKTKPETLVVAISKLGYKASVKKEN
jgi:copper chaperone CopZ